jgi:hypothetical protein
MTWIGDISSSPYYEIAFIAGTFGRLNFAGVLSNAKKSAFDCAYSLVRWYPDHQYVDH